MTRKQKITATKKQVREMLKDWTATVLRNVETSANSGMVPDEWLETGDYRFAKAVVHGSMMAKPYQAWNDDTKRIFANIGLSI